MSEAVAERHVSELADERRWRIGPTAGLVIAAVAVIGLGAGLNYISGGKEKLPGSSQGALRVGATGDFVDPPKAAPAPSAPAAEPQPVPHSVIPTIIPNVAVPHNAAAGNGQQKHRELMLNASGFSGGPSQSASAQPPQMPVGADTMAQTELGSRLRSTQVSATKATVVSDLSRTIMPGTRVHCILENAIDTTQPGSVTCRVKDPVLSWDQTVIMMEPGTEIVGEYQAVSNGQERIFAVGANAYTPRGVVIPLGDPFTDSLGRSGFLGTLDDKTWPRIKSALILDLASAAFGAAQAAASHGGGNTFLNFNAGGTENAINQVLRDSYVRDVVRLNQGSEVSLVILHPVFAQDAYTLEMRR